MRIATRRVGAAPGDGGSFAVRPHSQATDLPRVPPNATSLVSALLTSADLDEALRWRAMLPTVSSGDVLISPTHPDAASHHEMQLCSVQVDFASDTVEIVHMTIGRGHRTRTAARRCIGMHHVMDCPRHLGCSRSRLGDSDW